MVRVEGVDHQCLHHPPNLQRPELRDDVVGPEPRREVVVVGVVLVDLGVRAPVPEGGPGGAAIGGAVDLA